MRFSVEHDSTQWPRPGIFGDVCVARVPPSVRRSGQAVAEVLDVIGIDQGLSGHQQNDTALLLAIASWLVARRIGRLVLLVNECPTRVLDTLNRRLLTAGVELHVVYRSGMNTLHRRFLKRNNAIESPTAQLDLAPLSPPHTSASTLPFPSVPTCSFLWFRSTARAALSPEAFRQVDARLQESVGHAAVLAQDLDDASDPRILELMRSQAEEATSVDDLTTRCAGVQIAFIRHGHLLMVDIPRLTQWASGASTDWSLACQYLEPWRAATVVLIHMGLSIDQIQVLDVASIATDGAGIALDETTVVHAPPGGESALRALRSPCSPAWHRHSALWASRQNNRTCRPCCGT